MKIMENTYQPSHGIRSSVFCIHRKSLGRGISNNVVRLLLNSIVHIICRVVRTYINYMYDMYKSLHQKTNIQGGNREMVAQTKGISPILVKEGKRSSEKSTDANEHKLHLVMDKTSYARLVWLMGALQAVSFGEVLRRALNAYDIFDPDDLPEENGINSDRAKSPMSSVDVKHLYIIIPDGIKEQLDNEKSSYGRAYTETVRRALCVLTQLVRERAKLVENIKRGNAGEELNSKDINPVILASL